VRLSRCIGAAAFAALVGCSFDVAGQPSARTRALEAVTHANIGLGYLDEGAAGKAGEEFSKVVELFPDEPMGHANLAVVHLRQNKPAEADPFIRRAIALDPSASERHVLLGEILERQGRDKDAVAAYERALALKPANARASYKLAKLAEKQRAPREAVERLKAVAREIPDNVVVLLELARLLLQNGWTNEALAPLRQVAALYEGVEGDALKFLREALAATEASQAREAATRAQIFANVLRPTGRYRQGVAQLANQTLGLPSEGFSPRLLALVPEAVPRAVPVTFTELTTQAGLPATPIDAASAFFLDADNDGRLDLLVCSPTRVRLFRNEPGGFVDITARAGLGGARCRVAAAGDVDNDGHVDILLAGDGGVHLYRNEGSARFSNATAAAGIADAGRGQGALLVDLDHDGDLDLVLPSRIYRNRGDGKFDEVTRSTGVELQGLALQAAAFGDLDDDGDLDFLLAGDGTLKLYSNLRQGRFSDIAKEAGLVGTGTHHAIAVGDYNNDGWLDVFVAGAGDGSNRLYRALGRGRMVEAPAALPMAVTAKTVFFDARFADLDNDGHLDLLLAGTDGLRVLRNVGRQGFIDASGWLPAIPAPVRKAVVADYDEDGDLDILLVLHDGALRLLRNDGGNANHWLKVRLKGLNVGNNKNNLHGLGAKLEIKSGSLYAMRVADGPVAHFGLGPLSKADLLRVVWPNGEPDIFFTPPADHLLQAEQRLKGSCPFLYTWDGERYSFVTDIHWRNLLGMVLPDGSWAPPDPAKDFFKIPGEKLRPRNGVYSLQITEELWETTFLDEVRLLVVDHPPGTEVFVDEAFVPPPFPPLRLYTVRTKRTPVSAVDERGRDILPLISRRDRRHYAGFDRTPFQGYTKEHAVVLDLGDVAPASRILLFLHGWLTPFESSLNLAVSQAAGPPFKFPSLQVIGTDGRWTTAVENIGAPAGKDKTVVVDLTGKFPTKDFRVRIATTMEIAWDEIFFSTDGEAAVKITTLVPRRADLHERGFSSPYRASPDGPTLFDYAQVTKTQPWRPMEGRYTRYGDVGSLLLAPDDMYVVMAPGDELTVEFDAAEPPALPEGWVRDFVIYTEGWIKEGEINGAFAQSVEPLVFHGMSRYPYGAQERYPDSPAHRDFLRTYMTRRVPVDAYREQVMRYVPGEPVVDAGVKE
jgi:tetratricopeptide (TPR) repeat protein